jgi:transglutaminase-like putative cysteine protease
MLFEITHRTDYRYGQPAREAYIEARLTPPTLPSQEILAHAIDFQPFTEVSTYDDYFGNKVTFYSMTLRHERLTIINRLSVRTKEVSPPSGALDVTIAEARQLFASRLTEVFDYLQPTAAIPTGTASIDWARKFFSGGAPLGEALERLNRAIHDKFRYEPGSTDNSTPLETVWKQRAGVCQDFTHVMLGVLRTAGIPSRYVCGYIESEPITPTDRARRLIGSLATHAWVEALTPGMRWLAIDPTNNQWCGQRHVTMAYGRDSVDATPLRGTFKGSGDQRMKVRVLMKRMSDKA